MLSVSPCHPFALMIGKGLVLFLGTLTCISLVSACDTPASFGSSSPDSTFTPRPAAMTQPTQATTPVPEQPETSPSQAHDSPQQVVQDSNDPNQFSVQVGIDMATQHPISPLIYGIANSGSADEDALRWSL